MGLKAITSAWTCCCSGCSYTTREPYYQGCRWDLGRPPSHTCFDPAPKTPKSFSRASRATFPLFRAFGHTYNLFNRTSLCTIMYSTFLFIFYDITVSLMHIKYHLRNCNTKTISSLRFRKRLRILSDTSCIHLEAITSAWVLRQ